MWFDTRTSACLDSFFLVINIVQVLLIFVHVESFQCFMHLMSLLFRNEQKQGLAFD